MTLHVTILGIDGSGKSTIAKALPALLAAKLEVVAGLAGDDFAISTSDEELIAPGFHPDGFPLAARLAKYFKRRAKELTDDRKRYPSYKIAHMLCRDAAARALARKHRADVLVSDGNALLSATGRAANYRRPASEADSPVLPAPDESDLLAVFRHILDGVPLPPESSGRLPSLDRVSTIKRLLRWLRFDAVWLPDMVLFLDLPPEDAFERIGERGASVDRHENVDDLRQAREMYTKTLEAFSAYRSMDDVLRLPTRGQRPAEILEVALAWIEDRLPPKPIEPATESRPLGTTSADLGPTGLASKVFNYRYLVKYLFAKWREGSWREPLFALSRPGRGFLAEGYSARTMKAIYDHDPARSPWTERLFFEYPLHRAVLDRLGILTPIVELELDRRLKEGQTITLFSAPSGFAYDCFRPLEALAARDPESLSRVRLLVADLDPHQRVEPELSERAASLGIGFRFVRGDLCSTEIRSVLETEAPFQVALFVGLSSWLPKLAMITHLQWVATHLAEEGVLLTDVFTPAAYALSGKYVGYKASYYDPTVFGSLMDYAGFDGLDGTVASGRDAINHVLTFRRPR